jgi:hypothetical protein
LAYPNIAITREKRPGVDFWRFSFEGVTRIGWTFKSVSRRQLPGGVAVADDEGLVFRGKHTLTLMRCVLKTYPSWYEVRFEFIMATCSFRFIEMRVEQRVGYGCRSSSGGVELRDFLTAEAFDYYSPFDLTRMGECRIADI